MKKIFRIQKLILPGLQLRVILVLGCCALLAGLLQTILLSSTLAKLAGRASSDEARLLADIPSLVIPTLFVTAAVLVPGFLLIGALVTFRIAGPAYRLELYLRELARDEAHGECAIRSGDEFQSLCDAVNLVGHKLRAEMATKAADEAPAREAA
jgi:hypothetical protein